MKSLTLALALTVVCVLCGGFVGCALKTTAPVLTPTSSTSLTNGLSALSSILQARGVAPTVLTIISDAQKGIAQDITGATWGDLVRTMLSDLYSQLPLAIQNDTAVWATLAGVEVILATVGA